MVETSRLSGYWSAGWPEHKVRMMAQNKSRGGGDNFQSQAIRAGCPTSLPVLSTPALRHCALGLPRCGEDTLCHCDVHGVGSVSCSLQWHRRLEARMEASQIRGLVDNFRHRAPVVHEAFFLDDPCRSKVSIADLKSLVTADEDGTVQPRYNDTRLLRNQMGAFASNDLPDERFDSNCKDTVFSAGDFFSLLNDIFEKDGLAAWSAPSSSCSPSSCTNFKPQGAAQNLTSRCALEPARHDYAAEKFLLSKVCWHLSYSSHAIPLLWGLQNK